MCIKLFQIDVIHFQASRNEGNPMAGAVPPFDAYPRRSLAGMISHVARVQVLEQMRNEKPQ